MVRVEQVYDVTEIILGTLRRDVFSCADEVLRANCAIESISQANAAASHGQNKCGVLYSF